MRLVRAPLWINPSWDELDWDEEPIERATAPEITVDLDETDVLVDRHGVPLRPFPFGFCLPDD